MTTPAHEPAPRQNHPTCDAQHSGEPRDPHIHGDRPRTERHLAPGWLSERRRSTAAFIGALVVGAALAPVAEHSAHMSNVDALVIVLLAYLALYLTTTVLAFSRTATEDVREWSDREARGSVLQRYVLGTMPGPGISIIAAAAAMGVAMLWMPGIGTTLPTGWRVGIAVSLIVVAWLTVLVSFSVTYFADNVYENEKALDFPGTTNPAWSDYIYFGASVMTTFGTTDVNVASTALRRTVTVNNGIAFLFNTVTVAASVSALGSF